MFFNKKPTLSEGEKVFLNAIYDLILDPEIKDKERDILIKAKEDLEKIGYLPRTVKRLMNALRLDAISRNLSQPVSKFYAKLYQTDSALRGLENGAMLSTMLLPIWSGNI